jgi:dimethylglycine dehydrogenase
VAVGADHGQGAGVGRLGLAYFADEKGRIVTEMSVARLGEEDLLLITAATAQMHDKEWLLSTLPGGSDAGG